MAGVLTGMQFMAFPMFRQALDRLDGEAARLPGNTMRDEFHIEAARDSGGAQARSKSTAAEVVPVFDDRVLEVRTEASTPGPFVLPANLHKREASARSR